MNNRKYGIDLLRIISMMMIIMLHTLSRSQLLSSLEIKTRYEIAWFIEIVCYCAVDCFVLISGYVGINSRFKLSRVLTLWVQVVFYNSIFEIVYQITSGNFSIINILRSLMPVSQEAYWFFTCYFVLCFFMPFINKVIRNQSHKENLILMGALLGIFSFLPMVINSPLPIVGNRGSDIFSTKGGYSVIWFGVLYACGAIIRMRLTNYKKKLKAKCWLVLFWVNTLVTWGIWSIGEMMPRESKLEFIVSYTAPFVVGAAMSLLFAFDDMQFTKPINKVIGFFAPGTFGVYLIHSNKHVYTVYVEGVKPLLDMEVANCIIVLPIIVVLVFFACAMLDIIRERIIFDKFRINYLIKKINFNL